MLKRLVPWAVLGAVSLAMAGCDPLVPKLSGEVRLPSGLEYPEGATLEVRAGVATGLFEPSTPLVPDTPRNTGESYRQSIPLEAGQRSAAFTLGQGVGSSKSGRWRVVVWVSASREAGQTPPAEAPMGHADVELPSKCGPFGMHGHCQGRSDIRIDIAQVR